MTRTPDHYRTLGIPETAKPDEIHHAYRVLAFRFHPDRNSGPDAASTMVAVNDAFEVLSDPARRRDYDRLRSADPPELENLFLDAARHVLRTQSGWSVLRETGRTMVLGRNGFQAGFRFGRGAELPPDFPLIRIVLSARTREGDGSGARHLPEFDVLRNQLDAAAPLPPELMSLLAPFGAQGQRK